METLPLESVEERGNPPGASKSVTSVTDTRRKVQDFLRKYRHQGLPNAKKFRKATKIARLHQEAVTLHMMFTNLCDRVAAALDAVDLMAEESNWATRMKNCGDPGCNFPEHKEGEEIEVLWVSDGDPLEALKTIRVALDPNNMIPKRKAGDLDGRNAFSVSAGHGQSNDSEPTTDRGERETKEGSGDTSEGSGKANRE